MRFIPLTTLLVALRASELFSAPQSLAPPSKVNYPSNFQVQGGVDLVVLGDYLYWRADEEGLYYAQPRSSQGGESFSGKLERTQPSYTSGFRVGLGLNFPKQGMDLTALWTRFESHTHDKIQGSLIALWAQPNFTFPVTPTAAGLEWHLGLNVIDLEWGRSSWVGGNLSWRPFAGLRALLLEQALCGQYDYATVPLAMEEFHAHSFFSGGGLRAGSDARFTLPWGFSIYSTASGSLLYGRNNAKTRELLNNVLIARTQDHPFTTTASLQLLLGLGWDTHFAKDRLHIELHAGWEGTLWFNMNQMNHFVNNLDKGLLCKESSTLGTQGLTLGGRFCF